MEYLLQNLKCSIVNNIFKYMIFQKHQKVLLWSKGLNHLSRVDSSTLINGTSLFNSLGVSGSMFITFTEFDYLSSKYSKTCIERSLKNRQNKDLNDKW